MKIIPLNANVNNAKMKAYSVELSNGKVFTFLSEVCFTKKQVYEAMLERWPHLKQEGETCE